MSEALFIFSDFPQEANSSLFRILMPQKYLERTGHTVPKVHFTGIDWSKIPETVLLERAATPEFVEKLRMAGAKRIILTYDDNYGLMHENSPTHYYWKELGNFQLFRKALRMVDLSIVPSRALVGDFQSSGRVEYMPNFVDPDLWNTLPERKNDKVVIGWGGSMQHIETWRRSKLPTALKRLWQEYGDRIEIRLSAGIADEFLEFQGVPFVAKPWVKFEEWPSVVSQWDIGLAPLMGRYDERRSNIKVVEYGMGRTAYAASYAGSYASDESPGGVMVAGNLAEAWINALRPLIEDDARRKNLGDLGYDWARRNYLMPDHVKDYERVLWPELGDQANAIPVEQAHSLS